MVTRPPLPDRFQPNSAIAYWQQGSQERCPNPASPRLNRTSVSPILYTLLWTDIDKNFPLPFEKFLPIDPVPRMVSPEGCLHGRSAFPRFPSGVLARTIRHSDLELLVDDNHDDDRSNVMPTSPFRTFLGWRNGDRATELTAAVQRVTLGAARSGSFSEVIGCLLLGFVQFGIFGEDPVFKSLEWPPRLRAPVSMDTMTVLRPIVQPECITLASSFLHVSHRSF